MGSAAVALLQLLGWNTQTTTVWSLPTDLDIDFLWNAVSGHLYFQLQRTKHKRKVAIYTAQGQQHRNCQKQHKLMKSWSLNVCVWWNNLCYKGQKLPDDQYGTYSPQWHIQTLFLAYVFLCNRIYETQVNLVFMSQQPAQEKVLGLFLKRSNSHLWTFQCAHMVEAEPAEKAADF